jgi:hypothetical protein
MVDRVCTVVSAVLSTEQQEMYNDFLVKSKEEFIMQIFKTVVPNAKILAVNGRTLMTGRANFLGRVW